MKVKIDTKERFVVITPEEPVLSANIAAELTQLLRTTLDGDLKNVILKLQWINCLEGVEASQLMRLQQEFYEKRASFVICELQPDVEKKLDQLELLDTLNITRTESEAWDIVQMEEVERELMEGDG